MHAGVMDRAYSYDCREVSIVPCAHVPYLLSMFTRQFENMILIHLAHIGTLRPLLYILHCLITSYGILGITSFLFCEMHFISMIVYSTRQMMRYSDEYRTIRWHLVKAVTYR